ncbi:hypothetical protein LAUMK7_04149 [Mycobacterium kansasii]|uniref:Uncharacterized protein n=1 Tax=Mycobacterium kansasii TaxID=1768 RepID=A0A653EM95_MYCKA|nr:hypothetical protein MKANGN_32900 [Mycobacterium kansasii]VAZ61699.1 hypothetical protein LAUMK22_03514 [Mycobacterium kansasii]VAZ68034.1 hypothetical protein LAUMK40_04179 [Mycobacterium kansasii]VAZ78048.1 hypothetical protein LAUMK7_04149 [Mycobacterium kansasii]VTO98629.1 hypothetical protein BIN_B_01496 [Mycobacterium kansasii]
MTTGAARDPTRTAGPAGGLGRAEAAGRGPALLDLPDHADLETAAPGAGTDARLSGGYPAAIGWVRSARSDTERGVDLVAQGDAARVGVGLTGVVAVHHVRVADPVFQIDKPE